MYSTLAGRIAGQRRAAMTLFERSRGKFSRLVREEDIVFGLGAGELFLILVIVLIVFGGGKLSELGAGLGEGIKNFKKGVREGNSLDVTPGAKGTSAKGTGAKGTISDDQNAQQSSLHGTASKTEVPK